MAGRPGGRAEPHRRPSYADALAADPAEPHALVGWIVARAAPRPGASHAPLPARPELLQPLPSG